MFELKSRFRREKTILQCGILQNNQPLRYSDIIQFWKNDPVFRRFFTSIIKDCPFEAVYWETPPITTETINRPFEMVLINSQSLPSILPNTRAFATYFKEDSDVIIDFPNLGKNAILVVPKPISENENYTHLAKFIRKAPEQQVDALWKKLGKTIEDHLTEKPMWVSTAGNGIFWLHIRLDTRPKYYKYPIYKNS